MHAEEKDTASEGMSLLGCLRLVILAAIGLPIAFFALMVWLFPNFMGPPRYSYHHHLAVLLNHELTGNRYLIETRSPPDSWCALEGTEDLTEFNPNSCALVMYPNGRKALFCPRRSAETCFEVYLPQELWQREEVKRTVLATVGSLCDLLERQEPSRYPAPTVEDPYPNKVFTAHYRSIFSCESQDSDDIEYHLVVIPRDRMPRGVPEGFDRRNIADHLQLTWTRGAW